MTDGPTALVVASLFGIVSTVPIVWFSVKNRDTPGAKPLAVLGTGIVLWLTADILTYGAVVSGRAGRTLTARVFVPIAYCGAAVTVAGWGLFTLEYTGRADSTDPRVFGLFISHPIAVTVLAATNFDFHSILWRDLALHHGAKWGVYYVKGPAFWAHIAVSYLVLGGGTVLLLWLLARSQSLYRGQIYALLAAVIVPWTAEIFFRVGLTAVELTPLALALSSLLLSISVFRFEFMSVAPVAQGTITDNLDAGVCVIDKDGHVVDVNSVAAERLELSAGADHRIETLFEDLPGVQSEIEAGWETGDTREFEFEQEGRHYSVTASPLVDHHDRVVAQQLLIHDLTERKRRRQVLERQNEQLDQFASVVSHDLRNPLSVASGAVELAKETGDTDHLDRAIEAHERMEQLIEDMLELAQRGAYVDETDSVSLTGAAEDAWTHVQTESATLTVSAETTLCADRDRLVQLFENLFRNAVEHGPDDVEVTVRPDADGFVVADDGPGIPAEDREAVFRADYTTRESGTGLGLSIVRMIAQGHDWSVSVGESADGGACFEFRGVKQSCSDGETD